MLYEVITLAGAMVTRILLLLSLAWVMRLTSPLFTLLDEAISGRDIILILGGRLRRGGLQTPDASPQGRRGHHHRDAGPSARNNFV